MNLAVVAEPDLRERARCVSIIARQTPMSALGAGSWQELEQSFECGAAVGLIFYSPGLPGAPEDALDRLIERSSRVVLALEDGEETATPANVLRTSRPIAEETLILMARAAGRPSTPHRASFIPVDFLQMVCMSGGSHVLVLTQDGADVGIIEVREGTVWTAFDGLGVGEDAFARLIRPEMRARVSPATGTSKPRTIFKELHELLLDSLRRIDEGKVLTPPRLSASQIDVALSSESELNERIRQLNTDARRLLMERNYDEAVRVLIHLSELDPGSHLVRANLEQLRRLGYPK